MPIKLFSVVAMLILPIYTWGQSAAPYADLHKRSDVLTLSNGKYQEFFDQDSIQQIGSVLVNVNSMEVVKLLNEEETTLLLDRSAMHKFLSVDPLNGSFPMLTPYQFASNSPIQNIDLDGEEGVKVTDHKSKTITVIVEIDYAYVKGQPLENVSHIQNINQIDRIQKNLNKELNKHHYKDEVTGYDVQFSVIFNPITGTVANTEINGNMNVQDPRIVLQLMETETNEVAGPDKDMIYKATKEGESSWRLLRLTSSRNGHTIAHELFHLLTHKHENAPADIKTQIDWTNQTPGHNQAGGIFQYADDRTGMKEEDISQDNIQSVLRSLPERTPPPPVCIPDPTDK